MLGSILASGNCPAPRRPEPRLLPGLASLAPLAQPLTRLGWFLEELPSLVGTWDGRGQLMGVSGGTAGGEQVV